MIGVVSQTRAKNQIKYLLFDIGMLNEYRNRSVLGPFKTSGDFDTNSPGNWDSILADADSFLASPTTSRWDNLPTELVTPLGGLNPVGDYEPTSSDITPMLSAAFVYIVTKDADYGNAVKTELYDFYRVQTGLDMSNTNIWVGTDLDDTDFFIAGGFTKLLYSYDMVKDLFSSSERYNMEIFFKNAATYFQDNVNTYLTSVFDDNIREGQFAGVWIEPDEELDTDENAKTHHGGSIIYNFNKFYNNRRSEQVKFFLTAGIFLNDLSLINDAKLYFREFIKFGVFPDGMLPEQGTRFVDSSGNRETGYFYSGVHLGTICEMAYLLYNNSDPYFFTYSSSDGQLSTEGGPKTLRLIIDKFNSLFLSKVSGTKLYINSHNGESDYTIDGEESGQDPYIHHLFVLPSNMYYKSLELYEIATMTHVNTTGIPSSPRVIAGYNTWQGVFRSIPGIYFMYAINKELN